MKTVFSLAALALACGLLAALPDSASAQTDGYHFGIGLDYAYGGGHHDRRHSGREFYGLPIAPTPRVDQPPFFALFPPVYYDQNIVPRPYGISPYAVPAGIHPTEMITPAPQMQANPYFIPPPAEQPAESAVEPEPAESVDRDTF